MSALPAPIPLKEYMSTDYEPDCDYVDGFLEERNVGKNKHSRTQTLLTSWLVAREKQGGFKALTEQRVQVAPHRVRIPDICLVPLTNTDEVITKPPLLWIEIVSPDDRWNRVQTRLNDVLRFGVLTLWIIDPYSKEAWIAAPATGTIAAEEGKLRCDNLALELSLTDILPED